MNEKSNRGAILHSALAYLLLSILIWAGYIYAFKPVKEYWHARTIQTQDLQRAIRDKAFQTGKLSDELSDLQQSLRSIIAEGRASAETDASLVSHQLQERVKALLHQHAAAIIQLSPNKLISFDQPSQSTLDIRFRIQASQLDAFLLNLAELKPDIFIQMLSIRQASLPAAKSYDVQLDASLSLSVAFFDQHLISKMKSAGVDLTALDSSTQLSLDEALQLDKELRPSEELPSDTTQPHLAGLFDATLRMRLRDPRPDQYRLAGITLSNDAQVAVIADPLLDITHRLRVGEFLHNWRIEKIEQAGVTLTRGEQTVVLVLP